MSAADHYPAGRASRHAWCGYESTVETTRNFRDEAVERIESSTAVDKLARVVDEASERVVTPALRGPLRGDWMGHALHPSLTDIPLGCWIGSTVLDLTGDRRGARRLILAGVVAAVPTIASGLAEWRRIVDTKTRRLAAVHATGASLTTAMYAMSWWKRGRHPLKATGWSLAAGATAIVTGWVGGHLALVDGVGGGRREPRSAAPADPLVDAIAAAV
jgi:hypothetical protein